MLVTEMVKACHKVRMIQNSGLGLLLFSVPFGSDGESPQNHRKNCALNCNNPLNRSKKRQAIIREIGFNGVVLLAIINTFGADISKLFVCHKN